MNRMMKSFDELMIDKIVYFIEIYETINIIIKNSNKSINIQLVNVTLISEFLTNLMFLSKFLAKEIRRNIEKKKLHHKKKSFVMSNQSKIMKFSKRICRLIRFSRHLKLNQKNQDLI